MTSFEGLMAALGLGLTMAGLFVVALRPALHQILTVICGNANGARFWTSYSGAMMVLAATLGALSVALWGAKDLGEFLVRASFASSLALAVALAGIGRAVARPIAAPKA